MYSRRIDRTDRRIRDRAAKLIQFEQGNKDVTDATCDPAARKR